MQWVWVAVAIIAVSCLLLVGIVIHLIRQRDELRQKIQFQAAVDNIYATVDSRAHTGPVDWASGRQDFYVSGSAVPYAM